MDDEWDDFRSIHAAGLRARLRRMMPWQSIDPHYAIVGFLVGGLVGVTGVGGGSLPTPILILLFGISPAAPVGTDPLFAAAPQGRGDVVRACHPPCEGRSRAAL